MRDTLKARLGRLHQLKEFVSEFNVSLAERELSDAEVKVLREFYRKDSLAHDVAEGRESYRTRIEPIEEKYDSFWTRIRVPRKDETFDEEVRRVLGSMNNVGESYAHPEQFTTDDRRRCILTSNRSSLALGGCFGLIIGLVAYLLPESSGEVNAYMNAFEKSSPAIISAIMFAMPYGVIKPIHNWDMEISLGSLREATRKTDEFLRQHYI